VTGSPLSQELESAGARLETIAERLGDASAGAEHAALADEAVALTARVSELVAQFLREAGA
jgi:hypothetical protein